MMVQPACRSKDLLTHDELRIKNWRRHHGHW
jgi:hypothetical protein